MHDCDARIAALAARQHGVVSLAQVEELGGNRTLAVRRCRAGHWHRDGPSVYAIGGPPRTYARRVITALLSIGPPVAASHRTAARLWGVGGSAAAPIEVTVPRERHLRRRGVVVHRSRDLHLADVTVVDGVAVTGLARTLLDLGSVSPRLVGRAVQRARREHGLSWDDLLRVLVRHSRRGRAGVGPLRRVVAEHCADWMTDSETEVVALEILLASGMVPRPQTQVPVVCADGVEVSIDLGWPEYRALVEVFGVDHLTNEPLQHLDLHRRNQIELAGYGLLIYTGRLLARQPDQFVVDVRSLLRAHGCPLPEPGQIV